MSAQIEFLKSAVLALREAQILVENDFVKYRKIDDLMSPIEELIEELEGA